MSQPARTENADEAHDDGRKRPVERFHEGRVHVSIFPNESSRGTFHTATYQLRYKDKNEQFQTGNSYSQRDSEDLVKAASKAAEIIGNLDKSREQGHYR